MVPEHPFVSEVLPGEAFAGDGAPRRALAVALDRLRRGCRYVAGPPGRVPFEQLSLTARRADGRLELNCINLICLLASGLRAAGCSEDDVFVAVGKPRGALLPLEPIHAWLLWRDAAGFEWVDPADLAPCRRSGAELLATYDLFVIFNDRRACVLTADKRRLLLGEA